MNNYRITIRDNFFNQELTGEFEAESLERALELCREFYAQSLDTDIHEIKIVKVETNE